MYELVFSAERDERSPLHKSVSNAIEYVEACGNDGEEFEVWQVADDANRTRMVMVQSGVVHEVDGKVTAHYYAPRGPGEGGQLADDHSASRNVETLQREAPHLIAGGTGTLIEAQAGDVLVINGVSYRLDYRRSSDPLGVGRNDGDRYILRGIYQ